MKLSKYEALLQSMTVRSVCFMKEIPNIEDISLRIDQLHPKFPWIRYYIDNGYYVEGNGPKIYEMVIEANDKMEFVSKIFSTCFSTDFCSIWIIRMGISRSGSILVITNHSSTDGPNLASFMNDLVSDRPIIPSSRPDLNMISINNSICNQILDTKGIFTIPPNPSPNDISPCLQAKCIQIGIEKFINVCKVKGLKPQSLLSSLEIYCIMRVFQRKEPSKVISMISVNTRSLFGFEAESPICASTPVYTSVDVNNESTVYSIASAIQSQITELIPKHAQSHFISYANGNYIYYPSTSNITNIGKIESPISDIWIQGGNNAYHDSMKPLRSFTFHCLTCNDQLNMTFTYQIPGCEDSFVQNMISTMEKALASIEEVLDMKPIGSF